MGHSYGGMIAQMTAGAQLSGDAANFAVDSVFKPTALIAISPPGPIPNYIETVGWEKVAAPSLIVTGTNDIVPNMTENWEDHLVSFTVSPKGSYALVYDDMDHYMNGAYGRETDNDTLERKAAMSHRIDIMAAYMSGSPGQISPKDIAKLDDEFVELRTKE